MQNTNITTARAELFKLASSCIKYNNVININTLKKVMLLC